LKATFARPDFFHRHHGDEAMSFVTVMQKIQASVLPFYLSDQCHRCRMPHLPAAQMPDVAIFDWES
jgi:hypothetical protein